MKYFVDRKPMGRGRGNSKYKTYEKERNIGKIKKYRKLENIENIVKLENMEDIENLKIYKDIGKKLRI